MFGNHSALSQAAANMSGCRHVAVPMSGDAATLELRKANCTSVADQNYPWYDLIYIGNGLGWGMDFRHVQQHYCLQKGINFGGSTQRQMGSMRWNNASGLQSDNIYRIDDSATTTVGRNNSDPNNKQRMRVADNPFKPGEPCFIHRVRSLDTASSNVRRAALRNYGHSTGGFNSTTNPNMFITDRMPRNKEVWFASAYLFGDDPSFDEGETESWAATRTIREVFGFQIHNDDGNGPSRISGSGVMSEPPSPTLALCMNFVTGAETANWLSIVQGKPAVEGESIREMFISDSSAGGTGKSTYPVLWDSRTSLYPSGLPLRTKWLGFVCRLNISAEADGYIQIWHNALDTTFNSTPIVDITGYNDYDVGPWGVGFYGNVDGSRFNPEHRRGDPYHCPAEIYIGHDPMPLSSITMRSIPIRWHERNPARTPTQYAEDLMTLMKTLAYT